jgi:hypothetical protein
MSPAQAAALLGLCSACGDNRKPDEDVAKTWALLLDDLRFEDCQEAIVAHYRDSGDWIMPADIRRHVEAVRRERIRAAGNLTERIPLAIHSMEDGPEQQEAERAWLREAARRIGDGEHIDDVAPRLQIVPAGSASIKAITENIAKSKRAPGTRPREEGETA